MMGEADGETEGGQIVNHSMWVRTPAREVQREAQESEKFFTIRERSIGRIAVLEREEQDKE